MSGMLVQETGQAPDDSAEPLSVQTCTCLIQCHPFAIPIIFLPDVQHFLYRHGEHLYGADATLLTIRESPEGMIQHRTRYPRLLQGLLGRGLRG